MTKSSFISLSPQEASALVEASLVQRRKKEKRFRLLGLSAVAISLAFLVILFSGILSKGLPGMFQYYVELEVNLDRTRLDPQGDLSDVSMFAGEADQVILEAALKSIGEEGGRKTKKALRKMLSSGSSLRLIEYVQQHPEQFGTNQSLKFALDDDIDSLLRGFIKRETPEADRRINDFTISIVDKWSDSGLISYELSDYLFLALHPAMPKWRASKAHSLVHF